MMRSLMLTCQQARGLRTPLAHGSSSRATPASFRRYQTARRCSPRSPESEVTAQSDDGVGTSGRPAEEATASTDPFVAAALRLQNLVRGCGDGEDELLESVVANEPPEAKLQTSAAVGGMVTVAAIVISTLCDQDPWGGISLSTSSLSWAAVGALAGLPLVALRLWSWNRSTAKALPVIEEMHRQQLQIVTPWFSRMSRGHVALMMGLEVLPVLLLLLPAAQGVLSAWGGSLLQLLDPLPMDDPNMVSQGAEQARVFALHASALMLTAGVTAAGRGMELSPSEDEYEVVQTAMDNADRYYRLMAMDVRNRGADADRAALAFKCVAQVWLESRSDASLLAAVAMFADVTYLGVLWYLTGNLAAPMIAALASSWVDYYHLHAAVEDKLAKSSDSSSGRSQV